jgi:hypothetical protein
MGQLKPTGNRKELVDEVKPFDIPKREVWAAFRKSLMPCLIVFFDPRVHIGLQLVG